MIYINNLISISPRLALCGEFVRHGVKVADIGTDHAYLPVYLAQQGKITSAIAADLREGPLQRGEANIQKYELLSIITTRLSDGLQSIKADEADDIIIAGMGGELVVKIISEAQWLRSDSKRLILQPMSRSEVLREYLYANGYEIEKEKCVLSEGRVYSVMLVKFSGKSRELKDIEKHLGSIKPDDNKELFRAYAEKVVYHLTNKLKGIDHNKDNKEYTRVTTVLEQIKEMLL
ncbi:MAG: class I SAM-dependent methyltransferase [Clostridia bacterium]|nr:class I SAM-dependent methyltransferase [Clostridia bacterium]